MKVIKNVRMARERSPAKEERAVVREVSFARRSAVGPRSRPRPMDAGPFRAVTINHK